MEPVILTPSSVGFFLHKKIVNNHLDYLAEFLTGDAETDLAASRNVAIALGLIGLEKPIAIR